MREHLPAIRRLARDSSEVVRIASIVALSHWEDEESRPAFEEAVKATVPRVQRAGQAALERLNK